MDFIIVGVVLILISLYIERNPLPKFGGHAPPRVRASLADYSFGRTELYSSLIHNVPDAYEDAARALLGPVVYESTMDRALAAADAAANTAGGLISGVRMPLADSMAPRAVFFKEGEPQGLSEYVGQEHVVEYLQAVIDGMDDNEIVPREHQLFLGPPGLGKTLLVKCFMHTLNERNTRLGLPAVMFQESFPADMPDLKSLDRVIRQAMQQPTLLFIDEIHDLKTEGHALKLYLTLEEGRYKFEGEAFPVEIPNLVIHGATTDYGALHAALKRRFNRHTLMPLSRDQIVNIVKDGRVLPITPEATVALVARTHFSGAPWEALQLYRQALQFTKQRKAPQVQIEDIERVFQTQQMDALGLRWMDRAVIRALLSRPKYRNGRGGAKEFVCYSASEKDTCTMANVDPGEYRDSVKALLMSRGLLEVRATYGQALTPKAVTTYGWLVDKSL
jgi:Holliday junction resolvasome RuvABC ATP-dependent DNA helicase subunit